MRKDFHGLLRAFQPTLRQVQDKTAKVPLRNRDDDDNDRNDGRAFSDNPDMPGGVKLMCCPPIGTRSLSPSAPLQRGRVSYMPASLRGRLTRRYAARTDDVFQEDIASERLREIEGVNQKVRIDCPPL